MSTTVQLRVTGMTCGGCENAVKRALSRMPGVERVEASHRDASVEVAFDPDQVALTTIEASITGLGYAVQPSR